MKLPVNEIKHVGQHFDEVLAIEFDVKFCKLLVQYLFNLKIKYILLFFQISGIKLNVKFDKVLTFPGKNNGFHEPNDKKDV